MDEVAHLYWKPVYPTPAPLALHPGLGWGGCGPGSLLPAPPPLASRCYRS